MPSLLISVLYFHFSPSAAGPYIGRLSKTLLHFLQITNRTIRIFMADCPCPLADSANTRLPEVKSTSVNGNDK